MKSKPGLQGRTLCDRIIRACNQQLGVGCPDRDHVSLLVKLVECALHGYDISAALIPQSCPLYMEKILFHIVKKLSSLEAHSLCSYVSGLVYSRLTTAQQVCITSNSGAPIYTLHDCVITISFNKIYMVFRGRTTLFFCGAVSRCSGMDCLLTKIRRP